MIFYIQKVNGQPHFEIIIFCTNNFPATGQLFVACAALFCFFEAEVLINISKRLNIGQCVDPKHRAEELLWRGQEGERGDVCGCSLVLFSVPSNPHFKLFPALHRKYPTKGPTVTASAGTSGNVGAVAWGGGCMKVGVFRAAGQLWKSQSPHINRAQRRLPQAVSHVFFIRQPSFTTPIPKSWAAV